MLILTIRTDKPEAELGLYKDNEQVAYHSWQAHRQLAETIHTEIKKILEAEDYKLSDLNAIVAYKGPGSFTGLRIGLSVANALADSLDIAIVGITTTDDWIKIGTKKLMKGENQKI
ncbi:MAG TPA: tRNA (adenosine(37)-N6)-threonylcarbamoyltransferase complex dimerization subunit type 1 TsaB, partial [Methylomirabilota bacterium]|nr:tRNA (adenosine(37)-N6)-threonylcarbamoyltransferase complex dimerization subunit type 1 TsaB [Methylomirabilota bacterium]